MRPLSFYLDGREIYCHSRWNDASWYLPRQGDFLSLPPGQFRVQGVAWEFTKMGQGEGAYIEPLVSVHVRRLRPGEAGNLAEPTGYAYVDPEAEAEHALEHVED